MPGGICKTRQRNKTKNAYPIQIDNDNCKVLSEIPKLTILTVFLCQDDVNKAVKHQTIVFINVVEVHRVDDELVLCDSGNYFIESS